jgi:hypothetical protein
MKTDLTEEELLQIYGGSQQVIYGNLPYVYDIDGTPLQGQALIALQQGHGSPVYAFVGEIYRTVGVNINGTVYDLPGDNPFIPGPY